MALVKCPDCGNSVSDAAPACPRCGRPTATLMRPSSPPPIAPVRQIQAKKPKNSFVSMLWTMVVLGCVVLAVLYLSDTKQPSSSYTPSIARHKTEQERLDDAKAYKAQVDDAQKQQAPSQSEAVATATAPTSSAPELAPLTTTPQAIYEAYQANEVAADNQMAGHIIQFSAPVKSIDKDFTDSVVLAFATSDEFSDFRASLDNSQKQLAANLSRGQVVTVQCKKIRRIIQSPIGDECTITQ